MNNVELPITIINNKIKSVGINFLEYTTEEKNKLAGIEAEAEVNKINSIKINGISYRPDSNKEVTITIDQAALNLNVLEGATIPNANGREDVEQSEKKLLLEKIAVTGNIADLKQTTDTYVILNCGSSTEVI